MSEIWNPVHYIFNRDRDQLLDFLRGPAGPLGDNPSVIIRHIGICFDGETLKSNESPAKKQKSEGYYEWAFVQGKIYDRTNHMKNLIPSFPGPPKTYCCVVYWSTRALATTCCPGLIPETSCMLPGSILPPTTSTRRNSPAAAGTYTQSRSCKWRIAVAGTMAFAF